MLGPVMALATEEQKFGGKSLPRTNPSSVGIDPKAISAFIDDINKHVGGLHSMMLLRHGQVAAEAWWAPYEAKRPHMLFSLSKSFTSTAVGLAVAEKRLSVEDKLVSFFPDKLPGKVSENLAAMRVKDLLTMSTGHGKEPDRTSPDWVKEFLAAPVDHKPGAHFVYNTSATHVLAAIVEKVTGQPLMTYLTPRLFSPLQIEGAAWEKSPSGIATGGFGLSVKTEDIAKFGQLYLQKGKWDGKQLIPESWVAEASARQVSNGDPTQENDWSQGYGYQFWRCRHGHYRGDGAFGQFCIVMEEHDAVLAITSGVADMGQIMKSVWTCLLPGFQTAVPINAEDQLREKLSTVEVPFPTGKPTSPMATQVSGKTYAIDKNEDQVTSAKLSFKDDRCTVEMERASVTTKITCGTKGWVRGEVEERGATRLYAARGAWTTDRKFSLKVCYVESPFEWSESFEFDGDSVTINGRSLNVNFGPTTRPALKGKLV